jgi:fumarate hydratase class II
MGELEVPAFAMYGATTQRARLNFPISKLRCAGGSAGAACALRRTCEPLASMHVLTVSLSMARRFPRSFVRALGQIKQSAARVNKGLGVLDVTLADAIIAAAQKVRTPAD